MTNSTGGEKGFLFKRFGTMIDCSRNAVMNVNSIKKWIDLTADLGYNLLSLYMEDTYEVDGEPYFGYKRGRYTTEEIREIIAFAAVFGISVVPCIQTLSHLSHLSSWEPYKAKMQDRCTLRIGDEGFYELIRKCLRHCKEVFETCRIHIGMDEAWNMGRGVFMDKHGYVDPFDIFNEYMERLMPIIRKYGLTAMMWADMYFRFCSKIGAYPVPEVEIPDNISEFINYCPNPSCQGWNCLIDTSTSRIKCIRCSTEYCENCGHAIDKDINLKTYHENHINGTGTTCNHCKAQLQKGTNKTYVDYCPDCQTWNCLTEEEYYEDNEYINVLTCTNCNNQYCCTCGTSQTHYGLTITDNPVQYTLYKNALRKLKYIKG